MISIILLFIIVTSLSLFTVIANNSLDKYEIANVIFKSAVIIFTIWFALIIYTIPGQFKGTSKTLDIEKITDGMYVAAVIVVEPDSENEGGIYLWVREYSADERKRMSLNPLVFFKRSKKEPTSYKLPYTKKTHRRIIESQGEKKKGKGNMILLKRQKNQAEFKIVNPHKILRKN